MTELIVTLHSIEDLNGLHEAGADTVIAAEKQYAKAPAACFEMADLIKIRTMTHSLGMKMLILADRMMFDEDLEGLSLFLNHCIAMKVDGIIYSDLSVFSLLKKAGKENLGMYNPDTLITNSFDTAFYLSQGIQRIQLSAEITLEEMMQISRKNPSRVQAQLYGYQLMSHSKRHLLSHYFKNTGVVPSEIGSDMTLVEANRKERMPIIENDHGTSIYTGYVLMAAEELSTLKAAGMKSFVLDGHFLSSENLIDACRIFRHADKDCLQEDEIIRFSQKYPEVNFGSGYMYQKTNLVK